MRRIGYLFIAGLLLLTGCASQTKLRFGTAAVGGTYDSFGSAFSKLAQSDLDQTIEIKTTAGSAANLRLLSENYLQLAMTQTDLMNDAYFGIGTFEDKPIRGYGAVAALYTEACHIVVLKDSNINSINDLQGKKVSIGEKESGTEQNAIQILQAYGLSKDMLSEENLNYTQAASQLENGEIDAMFCTAGLQTAVITELAKKCDIKLLSIDEAQANRLRETYGFYTDCTIEAGYYHGQDDDVNTLGVKAVLLASDKLSKDQVEQITSALFTHAKDLQYSVDASLELEPKDAIESITIPFHKGAASYYNSIGYTVETEE